MDISTKLNKLIENNDIKGIQTLISSISNNKHDSLLSFETQSLNQLEEQIASLKKLDLTIPSLDFIEFEAVNPSKQFNFSETNKQKILNSSFIDIIDKI